MFFLLQYIKKRSNSPVETLFESKKFCHPPGTNLQVVAPIQSIYAQREEPTTSLAKSKSTGANRYLVPVPKVTAAPAVSALPPQPKPVVVAPAQAPTVKKKFSFTFDKVKKQNGNIPLIGTVGSFDSASDNDDESVILVDSDEEHPEMELEKNRSRPGTRTISVQTDVQLFRPLIKCACGRFTRAMTSVRSCGVQTTYRQGRKF